MTKENSFIPIIQKKAPRRSTCNGRFTKKEIDVINKYCEENETSHALIIRSFFHKLFPNDIEPHQ